MRKRVIALFLASTLVFGSSMTVWAAEDESELESGVEDVIEENDVLENEPAELYEEEIIETESYEEQAADVDYEEESAEEPVETAENTGTSDSNVEVDANGLQWKLTDGVLTITGNGIIERNNFFSSERYNVHSVVIETGVTGIGYGVFVDGFANLKSVSIPEGVTEIGVDAFARCSSLTEIMIPNSVRKIERGAFADCGMEKIAIPEGVTEIKDYVFGGCDNLKEISLPGTLKKIGNSAFAQCAMETIVIPEGVTEIGWYAFSACENLTRISFPKSMISIEDGAFSECKNLIEAVIPDGVAEIGVHAFYGCKNLKEAMLPNSVTKIEYGAFSGCGSLQQVAIPENIKSIAFGTFSECVGLQEVVISENVESIGYGAFSECTGLQSVIFKGNAPEINKELPVCEDSIYRGEKPFRGVAATAYYPAGNKTYTNEVKRAFGSELLWKAQEIPELASFTDVNSGDWYYDAAGFVSSRRIMTGMNPSEFGPSVKLSRAQFATILYRMEGEPQVEYGSGIFPDVDGDKFYTYPAMWAKSAGVISGYEDGRFGPSDDITREQMAVMMYRYANILELDTSARGDLGGFPDAGQVSGFADEAVKWAVGQGLIQGDGGKINPRGTAERAQCATIIMRFMEGYGL